MSIFVKNPNDESLINVSMYSDIRPCTVNKTHVDFYLEPMEEGKRGKPDFTVVLGSERERDEWVKTLQELLTK